MSTATVPFSVRSRFGRRLAAAFVAVAAAASGILAVTSYVVVRAYRTRTLERESARRADLAMVSLPPGLSGRVLEERLAAYQVRGDFRVIVTSRDGVYASAPGLDLNSVPPPLTRAALTPGGRFANAHVERTPYLVLARHTGDGSSRVYFFFSRHALVTSIRDVRNVLALGWIGTLAAAALFGHAVARRTLRPVRRAAEASRSLAEGLLETRLPDDGRDEFALWARSFNEMAAALQRKLTELSDAAEREHRFTADVAHDLRTPLTAMLSAATLLDQHLDEISEPSRSIVRRISSDVRRLQRLVVGLLELSRLDAGQEPLQLEQLSVRDALHAAAAPWRSGLSVVIEADPGLAVEADRVRFRRVVANLITNACDHGGGDVRIRARRCDGMVAIDVIDHGPGIDDADMRRIFDRLYKGDGSRAEGGSGLGLAIARESARLLGGEVTAANRPEGGACFTFTLRACDSAEPRCRPVASPIESNAGAGRSGP